MEVTEHDEESPFMKITEVMGSRVGFKMNSKILMTLLKGWLFFPQMLHITFQQHSKGTIK